MKKKLGKRLVTLMLMLTMLFTACDFMPMKAQAATSGVPVYRLFNPDTGEHLYTTDAYEKDMIFRYQGWGYEGIAWYAADKTGDPVYRLYNPATGYHLYTTDTNEINVLTTTQGWAKDFDGKPLFYSDGTVSVYRLFKGVHHLTTDVNEYNVLPQSGWQQEGEKVKAVSTGKLTATQYYADTVTSVPVYRLFNPDNGEHLYTTDANEKDIIYKQGWGYEGIAWYAADKTGDPVYRLCNPQTGYHLYTTDTNEVKVLTTSQGWTKDFNGKPLFYSDGSVPVYRLFQGVHHLTTDLNEYNALPQSGWQQEGEKICAVKTGELIPTKYCPASVESVNAYSAIEADVTLNGSGTGCHAKLVLCTPYAAVSYGIQYDACAVSPYTGKTMLLVENVSSNNAGGQTYSRPQDIELALGQTYHLMITYNQDGTGTLYLNGQVVGSYANPNLANQLVYMRVEGSARKDGDSVSAAFTNIKIKRDGTYSANKGWNTHEFESNPTIHATVNSWDNILISGQASGMGGGDWDSQYEKASGIIQFF